MTSWRAGGAAAEEVEAAAAEAWAAAVEAWAAEAGIAAEDTAAEGITARPPCRGHQVARPRCLDQLTGPAPAQAMAICPRRALGRRLARVQRPALVLEAHRDREHCPREAAGRLALTWEVSLTFPAAETSPEAVPRRAQVAQGWQRRAARWRAGPLQNF